MVTINFKRWREGDGMKVKVPYTPKDSSQWVENIVSEPWNSTAFGGFTWTLFIFILLFQKSKSQIHFLSWYQQMVQQRLLTQFISFPGGGASKGKSYFYLFRVFSCCFSRNLSKADYKIIIFVLIHCLWGDLHTPFTECKGLLITCFYIIF